MNEGTKTIEINHACTIRLGADSQLVHADGRAEAIPPGAELKLRKVGRGAARRLVVALAFPLPTLPVDA